MKGKGKVDWGRIDPMTRLRAMISRFPRKSSLFSLKTLLHWHP